LLFFPEAVTFNIQFRRIQKINRDNIRQILDNILRRQLDHVHPEDRVGVEINHSSLDKRALVPFTTAETMSAERILSVIERIQQSNQEFQFDQDVRLKPAISWAIWSTSSIRNGRAPTLASFSLADPRITGTGSRTKLAKSFQRSTRLEVFVSASKTRTL